MDHRVNVVYIGNSADLIKLIHASGFSSLTQVIIEKGVEQLLTACDRCGLKPSVINQELKSKKGLSEYLGSILERENPDLVIVGIFGRKIPAGIVERYRGRIVNIHPGLLPGYRGRHPVRWAMVNGESKCGVSIHFMEETIDTGDIVYQQEVEITDADDIGTMYTKLAITASGGIDMILQKIIRQEKLERIEQQREEASYFPPRKPSDSLINWENSAREIFNLSRVSVDDYRAFTLFRGKKLEIIRCVFFEHNGGHPGRVMSITQNAIQVSTGEGSIIINSYVYGGIADNRELLSRLQPGDILGE